MNFKLIIFIFSLFIFVSCGVKSSPIHPKGTNLPSYIDQVLEETDSSKKNIKQKKKSK